MREMWVATAGDMQDIDRWTTERYGIPAHVLMERAGERAAEVILSVLEGCSSPNVCVVAGKGNNGGDGLVVARLLWEARVDVRVILLAEESALTGLPAQELAALRACTDVPVLSGFAGLKPGALPIGLLVDAALGTGLTGPAKGVVAETIQWMNGLGCPIVALDLPSGMLADTGEIPGPCVRATQTVTFGLPKRCFFQDPASTMAGEILVADIGFPIRAVKELARTMPRVIQGSVVRTWCPARPEHGHKGDMGKVYVIGGAPGMTGAVCLAAQAALRSGVGMVKVGVPRSLAPIVASKMTEVMWQALPEDSQGGLSLEALNQIREGLDWCDVAVLGPGMSRFEEAQQLARLLITEGQRPLVVDADAMMAWQGFEEHLVRHHGELILTPHPGEFAGVRGMDIAKVQSSRLSAASQAARDWRSVVVLKGAFTAIAGEDGRCWVNPFAHSGLATAGSGDVLAGIVAGLWARRIRQGLDDRIEAACLGVWVHGQAGALASESCGASGLCAGDLLPVLGKVVDGLSRRRVQGSWDRMGILALSNRGE